MEEWRTLDRLPHYQVSNTGKVRSLKNKEPKILKISESNSGYFLVCLSDKNKKYTSYIHRLVAEAYLPMPLFDNQVIVNHKNKNRKDNRVSNLEWVTVAENQFHSFDHELFNEIKMIKEVCYQMNIDQLREFANLGKQLLKA